MLGGVNDAPEHARQLAALARSCRAFVNLIPLHEGGALEFKGSPPRAHLALRARAARGGSGGGDSEEPRQGHRRRLRPATGRTAGPGGATTPRSAR